MKVLISAGSKTQNIVNGIANRFSSGGVDFIVIPYIEDIDDIFQRGEYFDKAILLEQSWNHDMADDDEFILRQRVNEFANQSLNRGIDNISFVFLTQEEDSAFQVYEEILPIQNNSVVLVKQPNYSVKFFVDLIKTEIDKFPEELVYNPPVDNEIEIQSTPVEEEQPQIDYDISYDLGDDLGDSGVYNGNALPDQDGIGISDSRGFVAPPPVMPIMTPPQQLQQDDWDDIDDDFSTDLQTGQQSEEIGDFSGQDSGFNFDDDNFGTEQVQPEPELIEPAQTFTPQVGDWDPDIADQVYSQQSGDIPDYSGEDLYGQQMNMPESIPDNNITQDLYDNPQQTNQGVGYPQENQWQQQQHSGDIPDFSTDEQDLYGSQNNQGMYGQPAQQDNLYNSAEQGGAGYDGTEDIYNSEPDVSAPTPPRRAARTNLDTRQIRNLLDAFANRGNSILVTGCGGCGTSTISLNLANVINKLGYTVLLVDLDTQSKTQSYISKSNYDCLEPDSAGLLAAINSTSGINAHIAIVDTGFHLLTMGMGSDSFDIKDKIQRDRIARFINLAKTSHNFVIYDTPFETATGFGKDFTFMADNVVVTVDCSNWGVSKTMLNMCNIEDDDMYETMFNRGQLLFNRYRVLNKVMGRKVKTAMDITKVMDYKIRDLLGDDPGYYFQSMHICGLINEDQKFEDGWYSNMQYSDTQTGFKIFTDILKNIVLKS